MAEVGAFHEVLAPIWHAEEGADKGALACEQVAELETRAAALSSAAAPGGVEANDWERVGTGLVESVAALKGSCESEPSAAAEKLGEMHQAFHAIVELLH